jgi:hypothetical protein
VIKPKGVLDHEKDAPLFPKKRNIGASFSFILFGCTKKLKFFSGLLLERLL